MKAFMNLLGTVIYVLSQVLFDVAEGCLSVIAVAYVHMETDNFT